jgi:hypothetical protein
MADEIYVGKIKALVSVIYLYKYRLIDRFKHSLPIHASIYSLVSLHWWESYHLPPWCCFWLEDADEDKQSEISSPLSYILVDELNLCASQNGRQTLWQKSHEGGLGKLSRRTEKSGYAFWYTCDWMTMHMHLVISTGLTRTQTPFTGLTHALSKCLQRLGQLTPQRLSAGSEICHTACADERCDQVDTGPYPKRTFNSVAKNNNATFFPSSFHFLHIQLILLAMSFWQAPPTPYLPSIQADQSLLFGTEPIFDDSDDEWERSLASETPVKGPVQLGEMDSASSMVEVGEWHSAASDASREIRGDKTLDLGDYLFDDEDSMGSEADVTILNAESQSGTTVVEPDSVGSAVGAVETHKRDASRDLSQSSTKKGENGIRLPSFHLYELTRSAPSPLSSI